MKMTYILRGVPGSGKSTLAKNLAEGKHAAICSTDDFFLDAEGVFHFDAKSLGEFHAKNLESFIAHLRNGVPMVICDCTNIRHRDYHHYVVAAEHFDYPVQIISMPHPDPKVAAMRNVHGASEQYIRDAIERWEP